MIPKYCKTCNKLTHTVDLYGGTCGYCLLTENARLKKERKEIEKYVARMLKNIRHINDSLTER